MADDVVVGLGGNLGGDAAIIKRFRDAREALAQIGDVRSAALYRSEPIGPAQPMYLNTAVRWRFDGTAPQLIATVLEIERLLGRVRGERWGPRTIDLDVLLWGARQIRTPELEVPHPALVERRFALLPAIDVVGGDFIVDGETLRNHARRVASQVVDQIAETW
jgi:2-amino-4-hydroxy-6-hydroxymethyldihydropteridine diphosphokinase